MKYGFPFAVLGTLVSAYACGSDDGPGAAPSPIVDGGEEGGGSGGTRGTGGTAGTGGKKTGDAGDCTVTLAPSADDRNTIQSALDKVKSGSTVCFSEGTYKLRDHLVLAGASGVTFRGTGAKRESVLLDFTGQTGGEEGVLVTTHDFTVENLWIKNTAGNGIKVQADNSVFRNIKVSWDKSVGTADAGPLSGAYAIYPVDCNNTLMEDNEVSGAADAGIYAGQCKHVVARRNDSHDNVLGIEIENTLGAEVYDNDVHGNTCGFLLDLLPDLQQKDAKDYLVHDNKVHDNNLPNFAKANTLAAVMPQGTGVLVLAARSVELTKNDIRGNDGVGIIVVSYDIIDVLARLNGGSDTTPDPKTSRWPSSISIHDNVFASNGTAPVGTYGVFAQGPDAGPKTVPYAVLWDGILAPGTANAAAVKLCLGAPEKKTFVNFHGDTSLLEPSGWSTDTTAHDCTLEAISPLAP